MTKPTFTVDQIITQMDSGTAWSGPNVTFSVSSATGLTGSESVGFVPMSAVQKAMAAEAYGLWDDTIATRFTQVASGGQMSFNYSSSTNGSTHTGTLFTGTNGHYHMTSADTWLDSHWPSHNTDASVQHGEYGFMTYLHEIGHALGLDHPGLYDGSADYAQDAIYAQDTQRFTVMSYFDGDADGSKTSWRGKDGTWYYPSTPMVHDLAVIQKIYGADLQTRAGNTVYGFHNTADRSIFDFTKTPNVVATIWDAGGNDSIDLSGYSANQRLDLRAGAYSNVGGLINNLGIAFGATIESGIGGSGKDTVIGNAAANRLYGRGGADVLNGGAGADWLSGGAGNDTLSGGSGTDTVRYAYNQGQYTIAHAGNQVIVTATTGSEGTDTLTGIEKIQFHDHLVIL